jgi:hypothetical protein
VTAPLRSADDGAMNRNSHTLGETWLVEVTAYATPLTVTGPLIVKLETGVSNSTWKT